MKKAFFVILAMLLAFSSASVMAQEHVYVGIDNCLHIEALALENENPLLVWIESDGEDIYANMFTAAETQSEIIIPIENYSEFFDVTVQLRGAYAGDYTFTYNQTLFEQAYLKELEETGDYEFTGLLGKYKTSINSAQWSIFEAMSDAYKNKVAAIVLNADYDSFDELKAVLDAAILQVKAEADAAIVQNPARPSSGGGRGGSGSSVAVIKPVITVPAASESRNKNYFNDLAGFDWAKESINELYEKGIVNGTSKSTYEPDGLLTRAAFVKLLVETFECVDNNAVCYFDDVSSGGWEYPYVASAYKLGLVSGMDEKTFGGANAITREDAAVMVYRFLKYFNNADSVSGGGETYSDFDTVSGYAQTAVSHMRFSKIMNGVGDNRFAPKDLCNRAMAAKIICSLIDFCEQAENVE